MGIFLTIIGILALVGGGGLLFYGINEGEGGRTLAGGIVALIGIIVGTLGLSLTTVDARSVGIETKGGRYVDTLKPGRHLIAPWADVEQWTTRNQTMVFQGDDGSDGDNRWDQPTIPVRFANQAQATVDVTVTWAIADTGADFETQKARIQKLWAGYRTFNDMAKNLVSASIIGTTGDVFNPYNPFASLDQKTVDNPYVPNAEWSKRISEALGPQFTQSGLTLVKVQVTNVHYDAETEGKIKAFANKLADTRIAQQEIEIAKAQAQASKERATQAAPGCEALIRDLAAMGKLQDLPPAFNCGQAGGGVIVGTK